MKLVYGLYKWTFLPPVLAVEVIKTDLSVCLFVGTLTAEPFDLSRNLEFILLVCLFVMRQVWHAWHCRTLFKLQNGQQKLVERLHEHRHAQCLLPVPTSFGCSPPANGHHLGMALTKAAHSLATHSIILHSRCCTLASGPL